MESKDHRSPGLGARTNGARAEHGEPWSAPLRLRPFRLVWSAAIFSNTGVWMESVMAGYVMAKLTDVPSLVAALPLVTSLPGVLFALPSGAVSDSVDRRLVLLWAKMLLCLSTLGLAALAGLGGLTPFALLVFSALLGTAGTFSAPAWWSTIGDLVPERLLSSALSLDGFQWNIGQMVGPVSGGFLLAAAGTGGMFAVAGGLMACIVVFLAVWRGRYRSRLSTPGQGAAERVAGAVTSGVRYLANAPALQVACWRTCLFVFPASALTSLLPLFASRDLHIGAAGYGLLLAAVGAGSIAGAVVLPRLRNRYHLDGMLVAASAVSAGGTVLLVLVDERLLAGLALAGTGAAWLVGVTALNLAAREAVPSWVVSRALGAYLMVFQASIVAGALVWGGLADAIGVRWTLLAAVCAFAPSLLLVRWLGLPVVARGDMRVVARPSPDVVAEPEAEDGPIMILVDYEVAPESEDVFIQVMEEIRVVRRRTGASRWGVFEDARRPGHFIESFVMPSWGGYMLQRSRYTAADQRALDAARVLHRGQDGPQVNYFVHPESALSYRRRARWRRLRGVDLVLGAPRDVHGAAGP
jgi:MFS family permease